MNTAHPTPQKRQELTGHTSEAITRLARTIAEHEARDQVLGAAVMALAFVAGSAGAYALVTPAFPPVQATLLTAAVVTVTALMLGAGTYIHYRSVRDPIAARTADQLTQLAHNGSARLIDLLSGGNWPRVEDVVRASTLIARLAGPGVRDDLLRTIRTIDQLDRFNELPNDVGHMPERELRFPAAAQIALAGELSAESLTQARAHVRSGPQSTCCAHCPRTRARA